MTCLHCSDMSVIAQAESQSSITRDHFALALHAYHCIMEDTTQVQPNK